jgi:hypothetical protein
MVALNKTYRKTLTLDRSAKDLGLRFYSAEISRWLSRDPMGDLIETDEIVEDDYWGIWPRHHASAFYRTMNTYAFVLNVPTYRFDQIGLYEMILDYDPAKDWEETSECLPAGQKGGVVKSNIRRTLKCVCDNEKPPWRIAVTLRLKMRVTIVKVGVQHPTFGKRTQAGYDFTKIHEQEHVDSRLAWWEHIPEQLDLAGIEATPYKTEGKCKDMRPLKEAKIRIAMEEKNLEEAFHGNNGTQGRWKQFVETHGKLFGPF